MERFRQLALHYLPVGLWPRFVSAFFFAITPRSGSAMPLQTIVSNVETNPVGFDDWAGIHSLLGYSFAFMAGRIDPPSSLLQLTPETLKEKFRIEDLFLIRVGETPIACAFGLARPPLYYIGKLAVAAPQRGQGAAGAIIRSAVARARDLGLSALELQTRVELRENHRVFRRMGFTLIGASAHRGYMQATSFRFRKKV
jgi:GNAT superfamily N-acetyltransferase